MKPRVWKDKYYGDWVVTYLDCNGWECIKYFHSWDEALRYALRRPSARKI